jgi:hypothetical protein
MLNIVQSPILHHQEDKSTLFSTIELCTNEERVKRNKQEKKYKTRKRGMSENVYKFRTIGK